MESGILDEVATAQGGRLMTDLLSTMLCGERDSIVLIRDTKFIALCYRVDN